MSPSNIHNLNKKSFESQFNRPDSRASEAPHINDSSFEEETYFTKKGMFAWVGLGVLMTVLVLKFIAPLVTDWATGSNVDEQVTQVSGLPGVGSSTPEAEVYSSQGMPNPSADTVHKFEGAPNSQPEFIESRDDMDSRLATTLESIDKLIESGVPSDAINVDVSKLYETTQNRPSENGLSASVSLNTQRIIEVNGSLDSIKEAQTVMAKRLEKVDAYIAKHDALLANIESIDRLQTEGIEKNTKQILQMATTLAAIQDELSSKRVSSKASSPLITDKDKGATLQAESQPSVTTRQKSLRQLSQHVAEPDVSILPGYSVVMMSKNAVVIEMPSASSQQGRTKLVLLLGKSYDGIGTLSELDQRSNVAYGYDHNRNRWKIVPKESGDA